MPVETHQRPTCLQRLIGISTYLNILIFLFFLLIYIYWNNVLGHIGFRWVFDEAYRGLRWVSDRFLMDEIELLKRLQHYLHGCLVLFNLNYVADRHILQSLQGPKACDNSYIPLYIQP